MLRGQQAAQSEADHEAQAKEVAALRTALEEAKAQAAAGEAEKKKVAALEEALAAAEKEKKSMQAEKSALEQDVKNKHGEVAALKEKAAEQKAAMEKALRENDDLKTTRANYEAQINQMTEEFVRMNEQITRLEDQLEAAKQAPAAAPVASEAPVAPVGHTAETHPEEKKKGVASSLMSGFNKLKKMTAKEKEEEPQAQQQAPAEDLFGGMTSQPAGDDMFGGMSSTPVGDDMFGGMSSTPAAPEAPAEEDFLNLSEVTTSTEEKKSRWTMPFGKKGAAKEEKKKGGFGFASLKNAFGGKSSGVFPATEVRLVSECEA